MQRDRTALGDPTGGDEKTVRVVARGRVQGVGFRWYVREAARRSGIRGWVRNCPDGSVELLVAGDAPSVDRVLEAVRRGPPGARVDHVEVRAAGGEPVPESFVVQ